MRKELKTSKELINLANAIAKARFKRNKSKADIAQAQKDLEDKEREEQEKKEQLLKLLLSIMMKNLETYLIE